MPRIYRAMTIDGAYPRVAPSARGLGVRPGEDIPVDDTGLVHPDTGGMSVSPSWRQLPTHRIPRRLMTAGRVPDARGKDEDACWRMGDGPFQAASLRVALRLKPDHPGHGTVQPMEIMSLEAFQQALAATKTDWVRDEE